MNLTDTRLAFTVSEVAEMIGVTAQTVYRMIAREELPAVKVGSRNYRILSVDLHRFLDERKG